MNANDGNADCPACEGSGHIDDETACSDPDHCSPWLICTACDGTGRAAA